MDYRETLNLPKTNFPMKAGLPAREPERLEKWEDMKLYQIERQLRQGEPKFVLHDGPPYANGDIHAGTAMNKILKDIINRYWTEAGYDVVYVPGWDTHGLPIEMRALKQLGVSQHQVDALTLRRECEAVARHYVGVMTEEFKRLGVMGAWDDPYVTLTPSYEAAELRVFADLVDRGLIYRDLKAVYWCPHCETALAEGEIEYKTHRSPSIYVAFPVTEDGGRGWPEGTRAVIWTTTPWTIPANVAIALHPDLSYAVVKTEAGPLLLAESLVDRVLDTLGLHNHGIVKEYWGKELEGVVARHPYLDRESPLILGEHVTAESGTGLVHTAPGHGVEDFEVGRQYGLMVIQPLDDRGHYFKDTPLVGGVFYEKANPMVLEKLENVGSLLYAHDYDHQYAYCWRCKNPVIYRATSQWFMSIDRLKEAMIQETYQVTWDPAWGGDRMRAMVGDRNDWCLSRQRVWGLPIPAFYCEDCGEAILDATLVRHVAEIIGREGSNAWWAEPPSHFLPKDTACPKCGSTAFAKEKDIFDVWMDSGSSEAAVLGERDGLKWPADLVLEGNDQYRGWFQSLLTTGVATRGQAPYQMVLTHGMVLDKSGQEMHKSLGNTIDPLDIVKQYGSDILRLWVATSDFRGDVRISDEILRQLAESYRKIRNTFRFLLGNLHGFNPHQDSTSGPVHDPLNRWVIDRVNTWLHEAEDAYRGYHFHTMVHGLVHLMTIDLSSFYLDVVKDRLYTWAPTDVLRVETQRVLYYILHALTRAIAPVLVFTAEEVYEESPKLPTDPVSVHLTTWMESWQIGYTEEEHLRVERLLGYRDVILKALEDLRRAKVIGNSLAGDVDLTIPASDPALSEADVSLLTEMALAARVTWAFGAELEARAGATSYRRCERCWRYTQDVDDSQDLCRRCQRVLGEIQA